MTRDYLRDHAGIVALAAVLLQRGAGITVEDFLNPANVDRCISEIFAGERMEFERWVRTYAVNVRDYLDEEFRLAASV